MVRPLNDAALRLAAAPHCLQNIREAACAGAAGVGVCVYACGVCVCHPSACVRSYSSSALQKRARGWGEWVGTF